jgi:hypothetical protein
MNDRIKQFAEQAGLKLPVDTEYNGHIYRHALEKFAKLIVQDCIKIMHTNETIPEGFFYAKPAHVHELTIKQHFGLNDE